jgi:bifunctional non-homologous end joining protein LigD
VNDKGVISDQREQEKMLIRNFFGGKLRFELKGKKLKGKFTLIKAAQRGENSWLLTKEKDQHAKQTDITKKDKSVISGKTIEELASRKPIKKLNSVKDVPKPTRAEKHQDDSPGTGSRLLEKDGFLKQEEDSRDYLQIMAELLDELKEKKRSAAPKRLLPMLASSAKKAFDNPEWIYEIQWNGYRTIAAIQDEKVQLHSEENAVINKKFYPVHEALRQWLVNAIVDGEIVVVNEEGLSDKNQLDNWKTPEDGELIYYVFDLLWLNGYDLRHLPLQQRRNMLKRLVPEESGVRFSESFDAKGTEFFASAKKLGISGIVAKKKDSVYKAGIKTKSWLVIPTR